MKRYANLNLSAEDQRTWRRWQAWWIVFYVVATAILFGMNSLIPRQADTEFAETVDAARRPAVERTIAGSTAPSTRTSMEKPR